MLSGIWITLRPTSAMSSAALARMKGSFSLIKVRFCFEPSKPQMKTFSALSPLFL